MTKATLALCASRHPMPACVSGSVFPESVDPTDLNAMNNMVHEALQNIQELNLYVTGLTVALVAVINYCVYNGIKLTLYHFDRESGEYYAQSVRIPKWNYEQHWV